MSQIFISAAHKSSGKTTISLGLCAALRARGLAVQPYKKGPDYIDPMWLSRASARSCHNLDFYTMEADEISATVARHSHDADISLIEGNKGLYDGLDLDGSNSNAALAKLLDSPVILVLDARGMTRGIAPLILGYQQFDTSINIAGVILNQVGGERHEGKLRAVIEHYTDVSVLGAVAKDAKLEILERHLGLIPSNESEDAQQHIERIGEMITAQVDLDKIIKLARSHPLPNCAESSSPTIFTLQKPLRIGIAKDEAFGFYYPGDLDALQASGAKLIEFDTLKDQQLPQVDGLFIGGGFPETCMQALEANKTLRADIKSAIEAGLPTYAECGGLMYLARSLSWKENRCDMVGVIPGDIQMHQKPQGRGYVRLTSTGDKPWPSLEGETNEICAHEFHYSSIDNLVPTSKYAFKVQRGVGIDGNHDGFVYKNLLACYTHQRSTRNNRWTDRFLKFVEKCKYSTC